MKTSSPYSQALRIKRTCSKTTDVEFQLHELKERLVNPGYNKKSIDQQFSKGKTIDRNELQKEKTHDKEAQNKTPLVLTDNRFFPKLATLFKSIGIYLILAEHLNGYSKKNQLRLLKEIGI